MILLIGSGYVGSRFKTELERRGIPFKCAREIDDASKYSFVINAAGYTGRPNVDACESHKSEAIIGNILLPLKIAQACNQSGVPFAHVSSGCIYNGYKEGGYLESDPPNFTFNQLKHSFYSGTKAMAEELLTGNCYIWRLRIPFSEEASPRNYITKLLTYPKLLRGTNSLSHIGDFVSACVDMIQFKAPYGTYNVTNPGFVTTEQVVDMIKSILHPNKEFHYWDESEFYTEHHPRSNCVLNTDKLASTGIRVRPVIEALEHSLVRYA